MIGRKLGQYRIEGQLGAGGMGIVYRAQDLRSGQEVALKTISGPTLADAERRARFQREAELASSLHHPNIITVYQIGSSEIDGKPIDFIAMELVAGETLDLVINGSSLHEERARNIGIQLASGLSAAHAAGIVHRDLKPSNIMIGTADAVKILDFGLAKMAGPLSQTTAYGATQSVQVGLTVDGTILGSVAYMSPEQAEGKITDGRTDIFSFGSVMYEMLTGKQAFPGDSHVGSLSAVLLKDPEPPKPDQASPAMRSLVMKCLRKDPTKRWQAMADVRLTLEELRDEAPAQQALETKAAATSRRGWLMASAGLLTGLAPAAYFATRTPPRVTFERLTFRRGDIWMARFGPNSEIYYTAHWDGSPLATYLSIPGSREARDVGLPKGKMLSLNAAGESLVLVGGDSIAIGSASPEIGTLVRAGLSGGAPKEILQDVEDAAWSPDGKSIAIVRLVGREHQLEYPVGNILYQSDLRPPERIRLHPSNGSVAFFGYDPEIGDYNVMVVDAVKQATVWSRGWRTAGGLAWSPTGKEIWFSGARPSKNPAIFAVNSKGTERILNEPPGFALLHDVGRDGSMLVGVMNSKITIRALGSLTGEEEDLGWMDASSVNDISADGRTILFMELAYGEGRNPAIYIRKTDGSPAVKVGYGAHPSLSPDGKWIVSVVRNGTTNALKMFPSGAGEERTLNTGSLKLESVAWFPDQTRLLVTATEAGKPPRSYILPLAGGPAQAVTPEGVRMTRLSPDGRRAVVTDDVKVRLMSVPPEVSATRELGELESGNRIVTWSEDGAALILAKPIANGVELYRWDIASKAKSRLRDIHYPEDNSEFFSIVASPNGKWYAMSYQKDLGVLYLVRGAGD